MVNGNKKTLLSWIGFGGFVILLTLAFRFGGFYYGSDRSTVLLAQEVKENKVEFEARVGTVELDIKTNCGKTNKHEIDIEVLKVQFANLGKDLDKNTKATEKLNDKLDKLLDKL